MEKKSKAEKLKLRGINQTILISSYNSGAGTGPNDCNDRRSLSTA